MSVKKSIQKVVKNDINLNAFKILSWKQEYLIAKVLYDNGIKTQLDFITWLKNTDKVLPKAITNNVQNAFSDFEKIFVNPNEIPNIFLLNG